MLAAAAGLLPDSEPVDELEVAELSDFVPVSALAVSVLVPASDFAESPVLAAAAASPVPVVDDGTSPLRLSVT